MDNLLEILEFFQNQPPGNVTKLLDRSLRKLRELHRAEAGTIFLVRRPDGRPPVLEPISVQNDRVRIRVRALEIPVEDTTIAGWVAGHGRKVKVDDVYDLPPDVPYSFNKDFDRKTGYRTRSMLTFPLENFQNRVVAVVQMINRIEPGSDTPVPFTEANRQLISTLNHFVGSAIERALMIEEVQQINADLRLRNEQLARQGRRIEALRAETQDAFMVSVQLLSRASGIHDEETYNHILRVAEYAQFIARELGAGEEYVEELGYSAQLHDVGKLIIDPAVLRKRGPLTEAEWAEMRQHTVYGYQILQESPKLVIAADIALSHHEKWDGTGYPNRLAGAAIPPPARMVTIADVYDALRSPRPYKPAFSHEKAVQIILHGDSRLDPAGHFDPEMLALFRRRHDAFRDIYDRLADTMAEDGVMRSAAFGR